MSSENIIAIIPARGGSKSIPQKNIMDFCGKPLIAWSIEQALNSRHINEVYVSTDDEEIASVSMEYGARIIRRPDELATDTATSESALLHAVSEIEKVEKVDVVVFLQATSPVREDNDIDNSLAVLFEETADSLFSAAKLEDFCVWETTENGLRSVTYDYLNRGRRQDRKAYYLDNGSIYIFKPNLLKLHNNRLGGKISMYFMPLWKSYEIDSSDDIEICEYFMRTKLLKQNIIKLLRST